jgi:hypothetical protein
MRSLVITNEDERKQIVFVTHGRLRAVHPVRMRYVYKLFTRLARGPIGRGALASGLFRLRLNLSQAAIRNEFMCTVNSGPI